MPAIALTFDPSLDDEVRKNYNPNKIEEDMALPALPKILNESSSEPIKPISQQIKNPTLPKPAVQKQISAPQHAASAVKTVRPTQTGSMSEQTVTPGNSVTLARGTKIRVKLLNNISDRTRRGTRLSFVSQYPVSTTYFTIPSGTVFSGIIANSHGPQLSANGGLIVIKVTSVSINGDNRNIDANVTEANYKYVFFNNIKGKRKYMKSMFKSTSPGMHFCKKMFSVSGDLLQGGSSAILTPFSLCFGVLAVAGNVMVSPALALFYKGDHVYLKEGSALEIRLMQDLIIYN